MANKKNSEAWSEAKKRFRLNEADIQMAKELGMSRKSLLKNIPAPNQQWKTPVKEWVRDLYENKFGKVLDDKPAEKTVEKRKTKQAILDKEMPF
ncbi:hypothetical protein J7I93_18390 [Bacillus sp. ISL-47]|uniref:hypothetical protein n=1 Tax=Bacillus sp. ISL-47 TaxID=2819130 RepID=UPI001BEC157E|nr:hypothetical protein [Bacillus sp. ISL-47]MBT2690141.1 hypothetical protein [Bacillus sp. ISL-47]MBT2709144.1 hypothetical protein [Pseudomonas sp. ISL-84]